MASEQDRIADGINKPLMAMAILLMAIGFLLSLTIALLPVGLILLGAGGIWVAVLYFTARTNARLTH
ncbi:MAG: hypothetical protein JWM57_1731 [Phycisphaerales bacterium]|nr:hypothetical protein [Phycisphaerales bacterium]